MVNALPSKRKWEWDPRDNSAAFFEVGCLPPPPISLHIPSPPLPSLFWRRSGDSLLSFCRHHDSTRFFVGNRRESASKFRPISSIFTPMAILWGVIVPNEKSHFPSLIHRERREIVCVGEIGTEPIDFEEGRGGD